MPAIQSIVVEPGRLEIIPSGQKSAVFNDADIPPGLKTITDVEDWINNTWTPKNIPDDVLVQVHIISLAPLICIVGAWGLVYLVSSNHDTSDVSVPVPVLGVDPLKSLIIDQWWHDIQDVEQPAVDMGVASLTEKVG